MSSKEFETSLRKEVDSWKTGDELEIYIHPYSYRKSMVNVNNENELIVFVNVPAPSILVKDGGVISLKKSEIVDITLEDEELIVFHMKNYDEGIAIKKIG